MIRAPGSLGLIGCGVAGVAALGLICTNAEPSRLETVTRDQAVNERPDQTSTQRPQQPQLTRIQREGVRSGQDAPNRTQSASDRPTKAKDKRRQGSSSRPTQKNGRR